MAGNQLNNIQILDASAPYLPRSIEVNDNLQIGASVEIQNDLVVTGNFTFQGGAHSIEAETTRYADNHLYLNDGYETTSAQTGGLVVNYLPTATNDTVNGTFTAGVAATSNPTVVTTGSATFSVGQLIQIAGAGVEDNNGLFEVLSHTGTTLTIRGVGTTATVEDFTQNQFVTDATGTGTIRHVNIAVMRAGTDGAWETASGNTTPLSFTDLGSGGGNNLTQAYQAGNTLTTDAGNGNFIVAGTETMQVDLTGGIDLNAPFDFDSTSFDVQMTGANGFSIDGGAASNVSATAGNLTLSTITSGTLILASAGDVDMDAANVLVDATAGISLDAAAASNFSVTGAGIDLTLSSASGRAVVDGGEAAADAVRITASNAAGGIDIDGGTAGIAVDTTGPLSLDSTGTASNLTLASNDAATTTLTIAASNAGAGVANLDIDADGSIDLLAGGVFSLDGTGASNVTTTSGALTLSTATSGDVNVTAASSVVVTGAEAVADAVRLNASNAAGGIDIDAGTGGIAVDTTGALSLDSTATSSNLTLTANDAGTATLTIAASNGGAGVANLDVDADGTIDLLAGGAFSLDGTGASNVTATSGNLTLSTVTSGSLLLTSAGDATFTVPDPSATAFALTDGTSTYINVDSTAGFEAIDLGQHVNLLDGAGIEITTSASLVAGDLVSIAQPSGQLALADADTGTLINGIVVGVSRGTFTATNPAQIYSVPGSLVPVRFTAAPAAADNGKPVYLSTTAGQASMTPPGSPATDKVVFIVGYLQGGDGASTTVDVIFQPQFISRGNGVS